jgi:hypothetical protein
MTASGKETLTLAPSTDVHGTGPRRTNGRLRPMTRTERAKRQERRERLNPEREAQKVLGAPDNRNNQPVPRRKLAPNWFAKMARSMR